MVADFYAVQEWVDGFGNDTYTTAIFKTRAEAEAYVNTLFEKRGEPVKTRESIVLVRQSLLEPCELFNSEVVIVPQIWGEYESYWW